MELRADQLDKTLAQQPLARCYLLAGEEPLQVLEAADAVRQTARAEGFSEREVLHAEAGFDWGRLQTTAATPSLFSSRRILELVLSDKGPGKPGSAAISGYARAAAGDTLLLIVAPALPASARRSAWYKAIAKAGVALYAWNLPAARLGGWLQARGKSRGLALDADAAAVLATHTENNLLAAAQEIDRLALLYPNGAIGAREVAAVASDHARFDIFDLPAKAVDGDAPGALKSLARLREEGVDPVPITWALVNDIRLLYRAALAARAQRLDAVMGKVFMPAARKRQIAAAARAYDPGHLAALLRRAGTLDRINKGAADDRAVTGRAWDELVALTLGLAGQSPRRPAVARNQDLL